MKTYLKSVAMISLVAAISFMGCKQSMVISNVDYSQSIESVLEPDEDGVINDQKNGLKFNIKPIQFAETQDTSSVTTKQVRYIRGQEGYYYLTAPNYKHVYVMAPEKGKLKLEKKMKVTEDGVEEPAFNQRMTYIQLINQESDEVWKVTAENIEKEESQMAEREVE